MRLQKRLSAFVLIAVLASTLSFLPFILKVNAASVVAYIDLTLQAATAPSTIAAAPEVAISTSDEFYYSYVASATQFAIANTITITIPSGFTSVATCAAPTTNADGAGGADGSVSVVGNAVTYTFSAITTTAATTGVEICFSATTPAAVGNYSINHSDTNDTDTGAALIYIGDDNDVTVTATVPTTLTLAIKEPSTIADTNACALGVLNPTGVNTCSYRIASGTNSATGLTVRVIADDQLNTAANTADINDINTGVNTTIDAGVEEHGAFVSAPGAALTTEAGWTVYNDIPTTADAEAEEPIVGANGSVDDSSAANWATITHGASITAATPGGSYNQIVTYRAYANL